MTFKPFAVLVAVLVGAATTYTSQLATASFTLTVSRTGILQADARRALTEDLGDFARSLSGDADIYQRLPDGSLDLDGQGRPKYDRAKVEARIVAWLDSQIDGAVIATRSGKRITTSAATITQEEVDALKIRKPAAIIESAPRDGAIVPANIKSTKPSARPIRRKRGQ